MQILVLNFVCFVLVWLTLKRANHCFLEANEHFGELLKKQTTVFLRAIERLCKPLFF